jgi:hypothetical protein
VNVGKLLGKQNNIILTFPDRIPQNSTVSSYEKAIAITSFSRIMPAIENANTLNGLQPTAVIPPDGMFRPGVTDDEPTLSRVVLGGTGSICCWIGLPTRFWRIITSSSTQRKRCTRLTGLFGSWTRRQQPVGQQFHVQTYLSLTIASRCVFSPVLTIFSWTVLSAPASGGL